MYDKQTQRTLHCLKINLITQLCTLETVNRDGGFQVYI